MHCYCQRSRWLIWTAPGLPMEDSGWKCVFGLYSNSLRQTLYRGSFTLCSWCTEEHLQRARFLSEKHHDEDQIACCLKMELGQPQWSQDSPRSALLNRCITTSRIRKCPNKIKRCFCWTIADCFVKKSIYLFQCSKRSGGMCLFCHCSLAKATPNNFKPRAHTHTYRHTPV